MIIQSILDDDLYKFTQQQAVLELYPNARATYCFINRRLSNTFSKAFHHKLRDEIASLHNLSLTFNEREFLSQTGLFKPQYLDYLSNYRYDANEVSSSVSENGRLTLYAMGPWHKTILWEVKLMAIISELYFQEHSDWTLNGYYERSFAKGQLLSEGDCSFLEFGTRRRRSSRSQALAIESFVDQSGFDGTSNVFFAKEYGVPTKGTMAHEFYMGVSALKGLRHANRFTMEDWIKVYNGRLGVALTDTYGTAAFLQDFDDYHARLWDGVRQDSGDPLLYEEKIINHYKKLGIDPNSKFIVYSNALDVESAIKIKKSSKMPAKFGIGTHFTNDFPNSQALNMVIKLHSVDGIHVVKLSDDMEKACGDIDAVLVAKNMFGNQSLAD